MQLRRVNLGDVISWDGCDWIVDAHGSNGSRLNPITDGTPRWVDLATISDDESFEYHGGTDGQIDAATDRIQLAMLDPQTRADALFWLQHLTEARFGVVDPHDPDAVPRDGYGPATTIEGRMEHKAQELNAAGIKTSRTSLFRKDAQYRVHGITGLIDGRRAKESTGQKIPQIVDDAAHRVIAEHLGATTRDILYYLDKVKQRVRHDNPDTDVDWPSDRTLRRWLTPLLDAAGLTKSAQHRRSEGNRPKRAFQPILATFPGQFVEIDSNTLDVEAVMPDGKVIRPHMTAAIDVFTDSVVGFHLHGGAPSSTDHAILFARMVSPRRAVERIDHELSLSKSRALPVNGHLKLPAGGHEKCP